MSKTETNQPQFPVQQKTIPLIDAIVRTTNWRQNISKLFSSGDGDKEIPPSIIPKCVHIDLADIQQVVDDYAPFGYQVSGIRVYFTFEDDNMKKDYHINGIVVPTIKSLLIGPDQPDIDLIIPVPIPTDKEDEATGVSIYDFTRPCPPYCGGTSDLLTK